MRPPSSVMDADATDAERAQQQRETQQSHDDSAVFEAKLAGIKGEGFPDSPFFGTSAADVKARRHALGAYANEDFEATPVDPIDSYVGPRTGDQVRTFDELKDYALFSMAKARERHPDDFDDIIFKYVVPELEKVGLDENSPELQQWMRQDPEFAEQAYRYGLDLKNRRKLPENFEQMSGPEFGAWLEAHYGDREPEKPESTSKRELRRLNSIESPVEFAAELDRLAWRGR